MLEDGPNPHNHASGSVYDIQMLFIIGPAGPTAAGDTKVSPILQ